MDAKQFIAARKYGYRSGLELKTAKYLEDLFIKYRYEKVKIEWEDLTYRTYTPDFVLYNGIIIETKARTRYYQWCNKYDFDYYDRIIPEEWLKEKGKDKHLDFITFSGTKIKRRYK